MVNKLSPHLYSMFIIITAEFTSLFTQHRYKISYRRWQRSAATKTNKPTFTETRWEIAHLDFGQAACGQSLPYQGACQESYSDAAHEQVSHGIYRYLHGSFCMWHNLCQHCIHGWSPLYQ